MSGQTYTPMQEAMRFCYGACRKETLHRRVAGLTSRDLFQCSGCPAQRELSDLDAIRDPERAVKPPPAPRAQRPAPAATVVPTAAVPVESKAPKVATIKLKPQTIRPKKETKPMAEKTRNALDEHIETIVDARIAAKTAESKPALFDEQEIRDVVIKTLRELLDGGGHPSKPSKPGAAAASKKSSKEDWAGCPRKKHKAAGWCRRDKECQAAA